MNETHSKNVLLEKKTLVPQTGSGKSDEARRTKEIVINVFIALAVIGVLIYAVVTYFFAFQMLRFSHFF